MVFRQSVPLMVESRMNFNRFGQNGKQLPPNHWALPTAVSFGWTAEAAATDPLRSTAEAS